MSRLYQILLGLFVLGILVIIHELGHFLFAKLFKVRVLTFSVGFGKPLLTWRLGETEYRISSIPFGGYVHMAGEHPEDEHEQQPYEFGAKPIWQRAVIAVAGPAFNYVSALAFLWIAFVAGVERPLYLNSTLVGAIAPNSPAALTGIEPGDRILAVDGTRVNSWDAIDDMFGKLKDTLLLAMQRGDSSFVVALAGVIPQGNDIPEYGSGGLSPAAPAVAGPVSPGNPAAVAGIEQGDSIVTIDGTPVHSWQEMSQRIGAFDTLGPDLSIGALRGGKPVQFTVRPQYNRDEGRCLMGVRMAEPAVEIQRYGIGAAAIKSVDRSWELVVLTFDNLGKIFARKISARQLAGPVGIVQMSGGIALLGLVPGLNFMALISINLALLNLMPFLIITDGGLLFFMLIEGIRRKPIPLKYQMVINRIAIACLAAIFLFVTFNDIGRIPALFRLTGN